MNVTYADKDNAATIGTAERTWSAADANEVKAAVNTKLTFVVHGDNADAARGQVGGVVVWVGSVPPNNAEENDAYWPTA